MFNLQKAEFIKSAVGSDQFIKDERFKIVFAGRSNVGKSSVINSLLNRKNFARVGQSPGKTIHINYFLIDEKLYFIDIPGYGYAKVSAQEKERWAKLIEAFFADDSNIDMGILIVDARHKPTENDRTMAEWFKASKTAFKVIANKVDKLKKSEILPSIQLISETLGIAESEIIPFSAVKKDGVETVRSVICEEFAK